MSTDIDLLYEQQIKVLPHNARLQLLACIAGDLATDAEIEQSLSLLDLEGLGAEIWYGVDTQAYIDAERESWERP